MILAATGLDTFVHTAIKSLALGSLYALLALGFVLIFKATQTVNFAQGALALAGTWFLSMIFMDWNVPGRWSEDPAGCTGSSPSCWRPSPLPALASSSSAWRSDP